MGNPDIKATHLYEKFLLLFPNWGEKIKKYGRVNDILVLHTNSLNKIYFWVKNNDFILTSERRIINEVIK